MSMMGRFVQVSRDRLKQIIDDPSDVEELFASEQAAQTMPKLMGALQARMRAVTPQMLATSMASMPPAVRDRLTQSLKNIGIDPDGLARGEGGDALTKLMAQRMQELGSHMQGQQPPSGGAAPAPASGKGASISLDKAWHGVHYLLCGKAEPGTDLKSQVVMGGTEVGDDLGYGPARYFDVDEVAAIARELSQPNLEAEMMTRWDRDKMVQLGIYPAGFEPDDDKWLMDAFRKLRQFYVDASAAKQAVVTCLE